MPSCLQPSVSTDLFICAPPTDVPVPESLVAVCTIKEASASAATTISSSVWTEITGTSLTFSLTEPMSSLVFFTIDFDGDGTADVVLEGGATGSADAYEARMLVDGVEMDYTVQFVPAHPLDRKSLSSVPFSYLLTASSHTVVLQARRVSGTGSIKIETETGWLLHSSCGTSHFTILEVTNELHIHEGTTVVVDASTWNFTNVTWNFYGTGGSSSSGDGDGGDGGNHTTVINFHNTYTNVYNSHVTYNFVTFNLIDVSNYYLGGDVTYETTIVNVYNTTVNYNNTVVNIDNSTWNITNSTWNITNNTWNVTNNTWNITNTNITIVEGDIYLGTEGGTSTSAAGGDITYNLTLNVTNVTMDFGNVYWTVNNSYVKFDISVYVEIDGPIKWGAPVSIKVLKKICLMTNTVEVRVSSSTTSISSSSWTDITDSDTTVTLTKAATAVVTAVFDMNGNNTVSADDEFLGGLEVDGVAETDVVTFVACTAKDRKSMIGLWLLDLTAGSHTLVLIAKRNAGAGTLQIGTGTKYVFQATPVATMVEQILSLPSGSGAGIPDCVAVADCCGTDGDTLDPPPDPDPTATCVTCNNCNGEVAPTLTLSIGQAADGTCGECASLTGDQYLYDDGNLNGGCFWQGIPILFCGQVVASWRAWRVDRNTWAVTCNTGTGEEMVRYELFTDDGDCTLPITLNRTGNPSGHCAWPNTVTLDGQCEVVTPGSTCNVALDILADVVYGPFTCPIAEWHWFSVAHPGGNFRIDLVITDNGGITAILDVQDACAGGSVLSQPLIGTGTVCYGTTTGATTLKISVQGSAAPITYSISYSNAAC